MWLEILIGVVTLVFLVYYTLFTKENFKNLPPGPRGALSWFGPKIDFPNMHLQFVKWSEKYGEVFEVKIFGRRLLVLNSQEAIRKAFDSEDYKTLMNHRPPNFIGYHIFNRYKCVLFRKYDNTCTSLKREMIDAMDSHGFRSEDFKRLATDIFDEVIEKFSELNGKPCDPMNVLRPSFLKMIGTLFAGECPEKLQHHLNDFDSYGNQMVSLKTHAVYNMIPWIRWVPFMFYKHLYTRVETVKGDLQRLLLINLRASYNNVSDIKCMVHHLFRTQHLQAIEKAEPWLTDDHILGTVMELINTSVLTTTSVISGLIFLFLHFPEIQKKIQDEIDNVIGQDRSPELEDSKHMPYLRACFYECLRYQSHLPLTAAHYNREEVDIFGYTIPPKTVMVGNLFACHHDEKLWDDPWTYKPERFLTEEGKLIDRTHPNMRNLIPFGVGARKCVGEKMALDRMFLYTSYILQKFTFVVPSGSELKSCDPREMVPSSPVILPPSYLCQVVRRKNIHGNMLE